jgi:N-sulfoglucosamine sulfohydrolase
MPRCNVLYLHSHDTGRFVAPYGYDVPTPNLTALAQRGVLFRQAFCAGPTCSPSRAALLTGMAPHSCGMLGLAHRGFRLNDYRQHLVHTLKQAGYRTTLIGVQHEAPDAADIGYDEVLAEAPARQDADRQGPDMRHAADLARDFLLGQPSEPFFLSVGFVETHRPYPEPGPGDDRRYCAPPLPLPDAPETRQDVAAFRTSARALDAKVGTVLAALRQSGLAENTLVVCTTDHGIAFPRMKCNLQDSGIGVMLILAGPGGFEGGRVCDALVSHVDVFPTLCDLLEIEPPPWLQGVSLLPLVRGQAQAVRAEVFGEVTYHAAYEPMRSIRTERWKYVRRYPARPPGDGCLRPVLPNCDDSPSKDLWLHHGFADVAYEPEALYDLVFDPQETDSRAADPALTPVLSHLRARLDSWMHDTADPLLAGYVPPPAAARVNDPDGLSPGQPTLSGAEFAARMGWQP